MKSDGTIYCWTVHYGPRKWKSFRNRREARKFRKAQGGVLFALVRSH